MIDPRPTIAITLVTGRRPDLLDRTLGGFHTQALNDIRVTEVRANLDPVFGDAEAHLRTRDVILNHFPVARITEPATPGFGTAVRNLWLDAPDGPVLHLEDDWACTRPIDVQGAIEMLDDTVRSVSLLCDLHGKKGSGRFSEQIYKRRMLGFTYARPVLPYFNTSPGLFDGAFLRDVALLMDPSLDPEKQMRPPRNPALARFVADFRCRFLKAADGGVLLRDIGRDWRRSQNIVKTVENGVSTWGTPQ